jgi:hypothetical protein
MSIFSWFSRGKKPGTKPSGADVQTGMSGMESTRPLTPSAQRSSSVAKPPAERHLQRRTERNARRELLYQVVRESMVRAGVLSSGYKFKVLSLDQRGKEFMVMIDLAAEYAGEMDKLAEIEALVARSAKNRHDVLVQALYWRFNNLPAGAQQAVSATAHDAQRPSFSPSRPAPFDAQPSMPAPLFSPSQPGSLIETFSPSGVSPSGGGVRQSAYESPGAASRNAAVHSIAARAPSPDSAFEPLQADEVEAFKRALASGTSGIAASSASATPSHRASTPAQRLAPARAAVEQSNNLLLTGYEATELPDPDAPDLPVLSGTQYGELR